MDVIRAAGGVILENRSVALVHRPKYDDWSFPKGKLDDGEDFPAAALREVKEETGLTCRLDRWLTDVEYVDGDGHEKLVRYWVMAVVDGDIADHVGDSEIDVVEWVPMASAHERLTYDIDRRLLSLVR